ncbi:MAG: aminotransferase class I/II-fold pyridoxal phosphate-dependent enzyme [Candidatus Gracilibacteria bacterium]|nr:aminotransferase class I/II-fold pyridoxal phosphate-dependent enzyme [Candidatus Gracilibacteria bacterium]
MSRPITISLSPNVQKQDLKLARKTLLKFSKYKEGPAVKELEEIFKKDFRASGVWSFNSGRSALLVLLQALRISQGDEVAMQAFTCNAVSNPIFWASAKPIYVDIDESFNLDPTDLEKKISHKTKAVIVQHTFGVPAQIEKIKEICKQHNLLLIEDMAHALGSKYQGKLLGTFGDFAFFSFGRDKVISSVYGGMLISRVKQFDKQITKAYQEVKMPSLFWIKQQILHPLIMNLILPVYKLLIGKVLLVALQKVKILSMAVHRKERLGEKPSYFPARLPNALATLALSQYRRLEKFNEHRKQIAEIYSNSIQNSKFKIQNCPTSAECNSFRFTIGHSGAHEIIRKAWDRNLLIGDWYTKVLIPAGTNLRLMGYEDGSCPRAEKAAQETLNLPTHINIGKKEVEEIVKFLQKNI